MMQDAQRYWWFNHGEKNNLIVTIYTAVYASVEFVSLQKYLKVVTKCP